MEQKQGGERKAGTFQKDLKSISYLGICDGVHNNILQEGKPRV